MIYSYSIFEKVIQTKNHKKLYVIQKNYIKTLNCIFNQSHQQFLKILFKYIRRHSNMADTTVCTEIVVQHDIAFPEHSLKLLRQDRRFEDGDDDPRRKE